MTGFMNKEKAVNVIYLDLTKAFDIVFCNILVCELVPMKRLSRRWSQDLHCGRMRDNRQSKTREEKLFNHEDSQAVEQGAQRVCAVPILGGFQDQIG